MKLPNYEPAYANSFNSLASWFLERPIVNIFVYTCLFRDASYKIFFIS
jgi:hypothetical protein